MSETEKHATPTEAAGPTAVALLPQPTEESQGQAVALCRHVMETGAYCQSPALRERLYCYNHLRQRGERMRLARAVSLRQPYRILLPPLDEMAGVRVGITRVADALAVGQLDPDRAGRLTYALQQIASALRWEERMREKQARAAKAAASAPLALSPAVGTVAPQLRLVESYPEFEAEFGLPAELDLSQPSHVAFPPPPGAAAPAANRKPARSAPPPAPTWTKDDIESEELEDHRRNMSEKTYLKEARNLNARISRQTQSELRRRREVKWQAEADRRNAAAQEKQRQYDAMSKEQRRAYDFGIIDGFDASQRNFAAAARKKERDARPAVQPWEPPAPVLPSPAAARIQPRPAAVDEADDREGLAAARMQPRPAAVDEAAAGRTK